MLTVLSLLVGLALVTCAYFTYGMTTVYGILGTTFSAFVTALGVIALLYAVPCFVREFIGITEPTFPTGHRS